MSIFTKHGERVDPSLRLLWLFTTCSDQELKVIRRLCTEVEASRGQVLVRQGDLGRDFAVLRSGQATTRSPVEPDGILGPGSWFGDLPLLDRRPHPATIVAEEPTRLLVFQPREFSSMLREVPCVARRLLFDLAIRVRICRGELETRMEPAV